MKRRRFLTLAAAFAAVPKAGQASYRDRWTGRAMGAEVRVTLEGPRALVLRALSRIPGDLEEMESAFSLYRAESVLSLLNREGRLTSGEALFGLLDRVDEAYRLTDGLFDPTVQPVWAALAQGGDLPAAQRLVGWHRVVNSRSEGVRLDAGQQVTLNGIAQGFATDFVRHRLRAAGFEKALVDLGEQAAIGGPFRLGLSDPAHGVVGSVTLSDRAVATSSPGAMRLGGGSHILSPDGRAPLWSTVSIEAESATLADALSTAAVFMGLPRLKRLKQEAGLHRITVVDADGNLKTV
ncbi:FAD:protein FMN transferase [Antarctobacter jejuensis]|uniref:FAD:protein FMN transferase n=1 Tax=Antarctobacter jejuensis TaxID=1439938 RepID=UPI003FD287F0